MLEWMQEQDQDLDSPFHPDNPLNPLHWSPLTPHRVIEPIQWFNWTPPGPPTPFQWVLPSDWTASCAYPWPYIHGDVAWFSNSPLYPGTALCKNSGFVPLGSYFDPNDETTYPNEQQLSTANSVGTGKWANVVRTRGGITSAFGHGGGGTLGRPKPQAPTAPKPRPGPAPAPAPTPYPPPGPPLPPPGKDPHAPAGPRRKPLRPYQRRAWRRTWNFPAPGYKPGPTPAPGGNGQPVPHDNLPPPPREKERKIKMPWWLAFTLEVLGQATEGLDLLKSLYKNLPRNRKICRDVDWACQFNQVYTYFHEIDLLAWIWDFGYDQIEDAVFGALGEQNRDLLDELGWLTGNGYGMSGPGWVDIPTETATPEWWPDWWPAPPPRPTL